MKNKTLFINLSDIHTKDANSDVILNKLQSLDTYIETLRRKNNCSKSFIIISGDIAFSGSPSEYNIIKPVFTKLAKSSKLVMCAGNHDHDFSTYTTSSRTTILNSISKNEIEDDLLDVVTSGQNSYFDFEGELTFSPPISSSKLSKSYNYDEFQLQALNTAWCSEIKEVGGQLVFPERCLIEPSDSKTNILFFHHPLSWLEPNNQKVIRNYSRDNFDIIITGHEHIADSFKVTSENNTSLMIESISFDDPEVPDNGFISFIIEDDEVLIQRHLWECDNFVPKDTITKSQVISPSTKSLNGANLNVEFYNNLSDIGTGFNHINKDNIQLNDVFIYPNINVDSDQKKLKRKSSKDLLIEDRFSKVIITGDECCGKSTLIRKMYLDFINEGKVCISFDGIEIKKSKKVNSNAIEKALVEQYSDFSYQDFCDSDKEKVLFIDDFDLIKGPVKELSKNTISVFNQFDRIIVAVSDSYDLGDSRLQSDNVFLGFEKVEILKLGFKLRFELINKWNSLNEECQSSKDELVTKNNLSRRIINEILGKNYIPSSPFFLLTMLQSIDNGTASEMNTSSYGYYYQYLITSSFGSSGIKKEELDEMFSYVKELSFYYYDKNIKQDNFDNLWDFNASFCHSYGLKIDVKNKLDKLVKAKILDYCPKNELYSFKYPYIYYFFIAKYLADSLNESPTQLIIKELIESLEKNKNMSILMFLTHHSKDRTILDAIVNKAKSVFEPYEKANLDLDSMFIDNIMKTLPQFTYEPKDSDSHEYRLKVEENKDVVHGDDESEYEDSEDYNHSDSGAQHLIKELNLTFKSLELLGQLARNYYGSLKVEDKTRLIDEAISSPLRGVGALFKIINEDPEETIGLIKHNMEKNLSENVSVSKEDLDKLAREALFSLLANISFSFINKIATSIGNVKLMPVIEKLTHDNPTNSYHLIHLATKLDMGTFISPEIIKRIVDKIDQNSISSTLVSGMIINYLYMFEVNDKVVQKLCKIGNIRYSTVSRNLQLEKQKGNN
ncbi:metallophosphoesterase [Pseudoalteromonas sp. TB64]|uniref:metallophosphoesterase n=1 Tax=Pseudoalteromonas sp. TB64 TaxID=1938600 RepID=UPI000412844A|nr:metallophosphoesterase [Pseudoalteromonas sp. TB64]